MAVHLTYAFDAYCGWCYGFGPAVRQFASDNAERIDLRVLSGGLFTPPRALPIGAYPHIPGANQRISDLTGVTFGDGYQRMLAEGSTVMDSTDAATALIALRRHAPDQALDLASSLQDAWYNEGHSLSDPEVVRSIAVDYGLDGDAVTATLAEPDTLAEAQREFRHARQLGVESYPSLLLHTATGAHRLGGPVTTAAALTQGLERHLAAAT